ncbi:MAG: alpha/beta hydrolase [Flavobacteriaceae bacterium]|nr:alpha/beta hydrolase [Flavobacteriaceae bacterium]
MKQLLTLLSIVIVQYSFGQNNNSYKRDSIKIEHGYLHYYTKGKGKPVVLMQGNTGASSYYMRAIADSLDNYQTILVDFQGTGRSQYRKEDDSWIGIDQIVGDYETVRKHLKIDQWTIIGHSYGGQHALYYAVKYPTKVNKIISIGGVATDNLLMKYFGDNNNAYMCDADWVQMKNIMADEKLSMSEKTKQQMAIYMKSAVFNKEKIAKFIDYFPADEWNIVLNPTYQNIWRKKSNFFTFDFSKEAYDLKTPVRIIHGRQDPVGEGVPVLLNERMKNSRLTFIEKCGHFPWIDQPEEFFKIVKESLTD